MTDIVIRIPIGTQYPADLKKRLERYHISAAELARESGYNEHQLSRMFARNITPQVRNIERIEAAIHRIRQARKQERASGR